MPVVQQFPGDGPADRAGAGDGDAHQRPPSGPVEKTFGDPVQLVFVGDHVQHVAFLQDGARAGSMASPSRSMNATRVPVATSIA